MAKQEFRKPQNTGKTDVLSDADYKSKVAAHKSSADGFATFASYLNSQRPDSAKIKTRSELGSIFVNFAHEGNLKLSLEEAEEYILAAQTALSITED